MATSREQQRLALLGILRDFKREPETSDLDAALDQILAQREEICRLQDQLAEARRHYAGSRTVTTRHDDLPAYFTRPPLRIIRGGAA